MRTTTGSLPMLVDVQQALECEGYKPGTPPSLSSWASTVDAGVCSEMECEGCGHLGMEMHAFHRPGDGETTYRVIAACPVCGTAEEI